MTESATTAVAISPSAVLTMAPGANLSAYVQTVGAYLCCRRSGS